MRKRVPILLTTAVLILAAPLTGAAEPVAVDPQILNQMQETIRRQQEQLRIQAEQIKAQSELLDNLQKQVHALQQPQAPQPSAAIAPRPAASPLTVTSGNDRIKVTLSGQVDRALNVVNDGGSTNRVACWSATPGRTQPTCMASWDG